MTGLKTILAVAIAAASMSACSTLGGAAQIEADVFLSLHASIGPGKNVGAGSKVSANTCVLADVPPESLAFGLPGRITPKITIVTQ